MVVDDEKIIRDVFIEGFREYKIVPADNGQRALNILTQSNDIDLVIMDVMMPGLGGIKLLKEIKKINPNYKIIVLTGYGSKEAVVEALRSAADEFLEKPFDIAKVKEMFEKMLCRGEDYNLKNGERVKFQPG